MSVAKKTPNTLTPELSIAEICKVKDVSPSTVRRWIARGELRAYRYSDRTIRIAVADLEAMRTEVNPVTFAKVNGDSVDA